MALRFVKAQHVIAKDFNEETKEFFKYQAVVVYDKVILETTMDGEVFSFNMSGNSARKLAATLLEFADIAENGENS